jgi:AraC-like DNA-binding protein
LAARLSIRSYTFVSHTHSHDFHQLVLPLVGTVDIDTGRHEARGASGQCIIILAGNEHRFAPEKGSCFLVADMEELPSNIQSLQHSFVRISGPMQAFCQFVQKQLEYQVSPSIEKAMGEFFLSLMADQTFLPTMDPRIARVVEYLEKDLEVSPSLAELASAGYLSLSQLKMLFKNETGKSPGKYLLTRRMEKAKALLVHTDYPVTLIAAQMGYQDLSAFSHRFTSHFGFSPRKLRAK